MTTLDRRASRQRMPVACCWIRSQGMRELFAKEFASDFISGMNHDVTRVGLVTRWMDHSLADRMRRTDGSRLLRHVDRTRMGRQLRCRLQRLLLRQLQLLHRMRRAVCRSMDQPSRRLRRPLRFLWQLQRTKLWQVPQRVCGLPNAMGIPLRMRPGPDLHDPTRFRPDVCQRVRWL